MTDLQAIERDKDSLGQNHLGDGSAVQLFNVTAACEDLLHNLP